jgi:hypothetical protein
MAEIKIETGRSAPPRKETKPSVPVVNKTRNGERVDAVNGVFQIVGLGCIMTGQFADAGAIDMHGPGIANEVAELAAKNDQVGKVVDSLLTVGPYGALVVAVMPLVMQLLANHKIVPAEKMAAGGVVSPTVLEAQVKTAMARQAMEAMQAQREAEQELQDMHARFEAEQNGQAPQE